MKSSVIFYSGIALAVSACSIIAPGKNAGAGCTSNSDCEAGLQCQKNVCTDATAATSGGAGSADGGAAASAGAGSSAGSGASSGAGSSAGSSSGNSASGGASSGTGSSSSAGSSSGAGGGGHAMLRLINASPGTGARDVTSLDVCTKGSADADFGTPLLGAAAVAYQSASAFVQIPSDSLLLRVVAAGQGCSTALGGVADTSLDTTGAEQLYSLVALGAAGVSNVIVSSNTAPVSGFNVGVVNGGSTSLHYAAALPYQAFATPVAAGTSASADFAAFTGKSLQVGAKDFNAVAPDTTGRPIVTVVSITDTTLLVCAGGEAVSSLCATSTAAAASQVYVRVANIAGDADGTQALCAHKSGGSYGAAATATVTQAAVSALAPIDATFADFKVRGVVSGNCSNAGTILTGGAVALNARGYYTFAITGVSGTYHLDLVATDPLTEDSNTDELALFNGVSNGASTLGASTLTVSTLSNLNVGTLGANGTVTNVTPSTGVAATFAAQTLALTQTMTSPLAIDYANVALPSPALSSLSFWFGGNAQSNPYLLICTNDGSVASGNSVCASTTGVLQAR